MKLSVSVKLNDLGVELSSIDRTSIEAFQKACAATARAGQNYWIELAQRRLQGWTQQEYIKGLRQSESYTVKAVGPVTTFEITLVGKLPNNLEYGMPGFDMKKVRPGWLGGSKAKIGPKGKYVVIPFRHSISSAAHLAYSGKAKKENLKAELQKTVRSYGLDRMVRTATGQVVSGPVARVGNKAPGVHPYLRGLTRYQTPTAGTTPSGQQRGSSKLMTFRTMSESSPAGSWHHPGFKPQRLLAEVETWVESELDRAISQVIASMGLGSR